MQDLSLPTQESITIYWVPEEHAKNGRATTRYFFQMLDTPDLLSTKHTFPLHDHLEIGRNVHVYVPLAITETLKITVVDEMAGGKEVKKCAPYVVLPRREVCKVDNCDWYKNIMMLLIMVVGDKNFAFPITGFFGARQTKKELKRRIPLRPEEEEVVFFPRASMPKEYIKSELERIGVSQLTFKFLVNGKIVRDRHREVEINTNNNQGILRTTSKQKEAFLEKQARLLSYSFSEPLLLQPPISDQCDPSPSSSSSSSSPSSFINYPAEPKGFPFNGDLFAADSTSSTPTTTTTTAPPEYSFPFASIPPLVSPPTPSFTELLLDPEAFLCDRFPFTPFDFTSELPSTPISYENDPNNFPLNASDGVDLPLDSSSNRKRKIEDVLKKFLDITVDAPGLIPDKVSTFLNSLPTEQLSLLEESFILPLQNKKRVVDSHLL